MQKVILLTGCINPNGMPFTRLTNADERKQQYVDAIHYYLNNTTYKIVFCENSDTDIKPLFDKEFDQLEFLHFAGNKIKNKGKGYGEAEIIEYALLHSKFIQNDSIIVKITGRLIVKNIQRLLSTVNNKNDFVTCIFHSNLTFADSRIFCGTFQFYKEFIKNKSQINDSYGLFFEHVLATTIIKSSTEYIPFYEEPIILGISGSTGVLYTTPQKDKKNKLLFKCYSWEILKKINNISANRHINLTRKIYIEYNILKYKILSKYPSITQII